MQPHHHHTINNHLHKLFATLSISIISGLMITSSTAEPPPPSPSSPPPPELSYSYPTITIILTIVVLIFLVVGFLSMYFCRCIMHNVVYAWYFTAHTTTGPNSGTGPPNSSTNNPGIDPVKIQSFPTFTYSSVKNYRKSKSCELECAICLVEFEDSTVLRLITVCCHVFHQECIDLWLESHKTCPVCRMDLNLATCDNRSGPLKDSVFRNRVMERINENEAVEDVSILIDNDDHKGRDETKNINDGEMNRMKMEMDREVRIRVCDGEDSDCVVEKFSRSHSTGHSIVKVNRELVSEGGGEDDEDRFTLRLPENVKEKIMIGSLHHHSTSRSCTTFGEYCRDRACKIRNVELGEVSGDKNKG